MITNNVKEIDDLIKIISKLPGLGPKSAKRIVLKLIKNREELMEEINKFQDHNIDLFDIEL